MEPEPSHRESRNFITAPALAKTYGSLQFRLQLNNTDDFPSGSCKRQPSCFFKKSVAKYILLILFKSSASKKISCVNVVKKNLQAVCCQVKKN
jgi:hypothetical protein